MSEGVIINSPSGVSYCRGPVQGLPLWVFLGVHFSLSRSLKYSLEKVVWQFWVWV